MRRLTVILIKSKSKILTAMIELKRSLEGIRINGQKSQFRNMSDFKYLQPRFSHVLQIPIIQMHDSCNHEPFIVTAGKARLIDIQLPSGATRLRGGCGTQESSSVRLSTKVLAITICSCLFALPSYCRSTTQLDAYRTAHVHTLLLTRLTASPRAAERARPERPRALPAWTQRPGRAPPQSPPSSQHNSQ